MSCDFVFSMPFTGPFLKKKKKRRKRRKKKGKERRKEVVNKVVGIGS